MNMTSDVYIYHHGILGMKWGKKNGPPYPLSGEDHSASEKKAGWRKSLDKNSDESDTTGKKITLTDKQKSALKIGAAVLGTTLAAYGTYRLVKSGKLDTAIESGKTALDSLLGKGKPAGQIKMSDVFLLEADTKSSNTGAFKKILNPESISETIKKVNPNLGNPDYRNNCSACGVASFLRTQGYDVTAKGTGGKQTILGGVIEECFKGAKVLDGTATKFGKSKEDAAELLVNKFGKNASGVVSVQWKNKAVGGHTFNWMIKDGVTQFFDGQVANSGCDLYWNRIDPSDSLTIARLDNAEIDFDAVKKYVQAR